jgi:hypothetical protein
MVGCSTINDASGGDAVAEDTQNRLWPDGPPWPAVPIWIRLYGMLSSPEHGHMCRLYSRLPPLPLAHVCRETRDFVLKRQGVPKARHHQQGCAEPRWESLLCLPSIPLTKRSADYPSDLSRLVSEGEPVILRLKDRDFTYDSRKILALCLSAVDRQIKLPVAGYLVAKRPANHRAAQLISRWKHHLPCFVGLRDDSALRELQVQLKLMSERTTTDILDNPRSREVIIDKILQPIKDIWDAHNARSLAEGNGELHRLPEIDVVVELIVGPERETNRARARPSSR